MTDQIAEILIVDGVRMRTITHPPLPHNTSLLQLTPAEEIAGECTGCWRGYVATWEIEDARLYLKAIDGPMAGVPPEWRMTTTERVPATWFTGLLRAPVGRLKRIPTGYEEELHFKIFEGRVLSRRLIDNRPQSGSTQKA
jgi:hypothetical protein